MFNLLKKTPLFLLLVLFFSCFSLTFVLPRIYTFGSSEESASIQFFRTNNQGEKSDRFWSDLANRASNYVLVFDPKSPDLDFKVSLGLAHGIYAKTNQGELLKAYIPKRFKEIITDENAKLDGKLLIAAINGDYIDIDHKPQGLNISRGVEYSGIFKNKRSSFAISSGTKSRKATIQIGYRKEKNLNYNVVGGNGRFYKDGQFKNICKDLGDYACASEISRSMVAVTSTGQVILLVNNSDLYPDEFDNVLEGIAKENNLGKIQDAMLFDGGLSTALYYNNKIYVENSNPIGSVFLIYQTTTK